MHYVLCSCKSRYSSFVSRKSYQQLCGLARGLDLVGERWTLLLLRELMFGPRRFVDLLEALPGIGPTTLSTRLRTLEADGLILRSSLPPPAASAVYRLTHAGTMLEPVIVELGRWGLSQLELATDPGVFRPEWALFGFKLALGQGPVDLEDCDYQFLIDGVPLLVRIRSGRVAVLQSLAENPDVGFVTDGATVKEVVIGDLAPHEAVEAGRVTVEGRFDLVYPLLRLISEAMGWRSPSPVGDQG